MVKKEKPGVWKEVKNFGSDSWRLLEKCKKPDKKGKGNN